MTGQNFCGDRFGRMDDPGHEPQLGVLHTISAGRDARTIGKRGLPPQHLSSSPDETRDSRPSPSLGQVGQRRLQPRRRSVIVNREMGAVIHFPLAAMQCTLPAPHHGVLQVWQVIRIVVAIVQRTLNKPRIDLTSS
jgi:hypothetical protein